MNYFLKNKLYFMNTSITLHLSFGKFKRVDCSNVNIQIHQTSSIHNFSPAIASPLSSDGKSVLLVTETRKLGRNLDSSPFSHTPLWDCLEILQTLPSVYSESDCFSPCSPLSPWTSTTVLSHGLIAVAYSLLCPLPPSPRQPPPIYFQHGSQSEPLKT